MIKHFCDRCGAEIIKCDLELIEVKTTLSVRNLSDAHRPMWLSDALVF